MLAQWKGLHLDERERHIPVENSKTGKPHIIYLSTQAQTLFKELKPLASSSDWVLPSRDTLAKPFANNALNQALKVSLQEQKTPSFTIHDLWRTASTLLHEQDWSSDVVEKTLNHTISGVRDIYNWAKYAEQRREMLQAWSDYIDRLAPSANLVV